MPAGLTNYRLQSVISNHFPSARAKAGTGTVEGVLQYVNDGLGPNLLVNGTTYLGSLFVCPVDGAYIKEIWLGCAVAIASGTTTLAIDNYNKAGSANRNVLSTTNIDATASTLTAKNGLQLTLSTTLTNLYMDKGDVLNFTLAVGTQGTAGQGYTLTALVILPEPA